MNKWRAQLFPQKKIRTNLSGFINFLSFIAVHSWATNKMDGRAVIGNKQKQMAALEDECLDS